jgi:hypothetical protein
MKLKHCLQRHFTWYCQQPGFHWKTLPAVGLELRRRYITDRWSLYHGSRRLAVLDTSLKYSMDEAAALRKGGL